MTACARLPSGTERTHTGARRHLEQAATDDQSRPAAGERHRSSRGAGGRESFLEGRRSTSGCRPERQDQVAAAACRRALIIDPELVPAIVNLANIHYARDDYREAEALYERAIMLDGECFEALNLGNIHHDLSRYQ